MKSAGIFSKITGPLETKDFAPKNKRPGPEKETIYTLPKYPFSGNMVKLPGEYPYMERVHIPPGEKEGY